MNKYLILIIILILSSCATPPTEKPGTKKLNEVDNALMVYVPSGKFLMGAKDEDLDANWHEKPQHDVYIDAYWIYQHEVSNKQFATFIAETGYQTTAEIIGWSVVVGDGTFKDTPGAYWAAPEGPDSNLAGLDDYPVVQVSWDDAFAYCEWAMCQLPTEAQWEKAARGTDGRTYPWGEEMPNCDLVNYNECVGSATPTNSNLNGVSPYGALNLSGNVYEWVADYFKDDYYGQRSSKKNPQGPKNGEYRIIRGGSWNNYERDLRASHRHSKSPDLMFNSLGFRCVCHP